MFIVYDSNKLAQYPEQKIHYSWDNCKFETLPEAIEYAKKYFYPYQPPIGLGKIDYSGFGDFAEIREE
jgi:hypothetical protein